MQFLTKVNPKLLALSIGVLLIASNTITYHLAKPNYQKSMEQFYGNKTDEEINERMKRIRENRNGSMGF